MNIIQIYKQFPTHEDCIAHLESVRWPGGARCPYCKSDRVSALPSEHRHHCNACNTSFSVTVGTIFHNTKLDLQKWFLAISLILNAKKGISSRQLSRDLEVNKNTAWYMAMRIRKAMTEQRELLQGVVEMDETYVGGKVRKGSDNPGKRGRGTGKVPVVGMIERGGNVKAKPVKNVSQKTLASLVRGGVKTDNATMITDEFSGYFTFPLFVKHQTINHSVCYADGDVHTNNIEAFWAILKRGIVGQFHKVSAHHLHEYVDEFCYRYNHRHNPNVFALTISRAVGART
jgi:transposase-like protein